MDQEDDRSRQPADRPPAADTGCSVAAGEAEFQQRIRELTAINNVARAVVSSLSVKEVISCACEQISAAPAPALIAAYLLEGDKLLLHEFWDKGLKESARPEAVTRVGECLCGLAAKLRKPIYSADVRKDPRVTLDVCTHAGITSFAALPLMFRDEVLAVLGLGWHEERELARQAQFLETIADQTAAGIQNARLHEHARQYAEELEQRVNESTRAQKALQESEERFRTVFSTSPDAVILSTLEDGRIVDANEAFTALTGYSREEALGKTSLDLGIWLDPRDREKLIEPLRRTGSAKDVEALFRMKDGALRIGLMSAKVIMLGGAAYVVSVTKDIDEWRRTQEALRANELRLRTFMETFHGIAFSVGLDLKPIFLHGAVEAITGYSEEELLAENPRLDKLVHPDDRERVLGTIKQMRSVSDCTWEQEFRIKHKDGKSRWVHAFIRNVCDDSGKPQYFQGAVYDITEQRKLQEERDRLFNLSLDMLCIAGFDGMFKQVNPAWTGTLGWSEEELLSRPWIEFIHPDDREATLSAGERLSEGNAVHSFESRFSCKEGPCRWLSWTAFPLPEDKLIFAVARDVTGRKESMENLRIESEKFRTLAEHAPFGLCMIGEDGRFVYINPKFTDMFGYDLNDVPDGRHWFRLAYPDQYYRHEVISTWLQDVERAGVGEARPRVFTVRCKDGADKIIHFRSVRLATGEDLMSCEDITERTLARQKLLESERRYRILFDESRDGIFITSRDGTLMDANRSFLEIFGYAREEMIGTNVRELYLNPFDRERYQQTIESEGSVKDYELLLKNREGGELSCQLTATVRQGEDGSVLGYQGSVRDVTERKRLERQLLHAQKMEALGTLAGGIAHDFNNLLQIIMGYVELLLFGKKPQDPDYARLQAVQKAALKGSELVRRILLFGRKVEAQRRPINLNEEITQALELLDRTVPKTIEISLHMARGLKMVNADPGQLTQILLNLTVNAMDAMPDGGKLTIETGNVTLNEQYCSTHIEAKPGDYVLLSVSDTGYGMEKAVLEHIFEPFFTTKKMGEGTGLGLAMVFGIVKNHGGYVTCYSEPGMGTVFKVYLPAMETEVARAIESDAETPTGGVETILLVDDQESIRVLAGEFLTLAGYKVLTASNGREALEIFKEKRADISLVILDLIMPEMGGRQCLDELLKIDPDARVVLASGFSFNGQMSKDIEQRTRGFVEKPYEMQQLLRVVREVLDAG